MAKNLLTMNEKTKSYRPPLLVAFLLLLAGASVSIHQFKVPPLMTKVALSIGLPPEGGPWLMTVFLLVCLIFAIPAGMFVQRAGPKKSLLISMALVTAGSLIGFFFPSPALLLLSRGVEGLGFLLISVAIPVAAAVYVNPAKIGMVMGISMVWISVGQIIAFNSAPRLASLGGWPLVWVIYGVFTLLAAGAIFLAFRGEVEKGEVKAGNGGQNSSMVDALKNKNLIFPSVGFMTFNFCLIVVVTFFPEYASMSGLMSLKEASFIASLPMVFSLVGSPILGKLADRVGHKGLYSLSVLAAGAGSTLMFVPSLPVIMGGAALLGFIGAAAPCLIFSSLGKLSPPELLAQSNGIVVLFQNGGMFLGVLLFPLLIKAFPGNYLPAASFMALLSIVAATLVSFTLYRESFN